MGAMKSVGVLPVALLAATFEGLSGIVLPLIVRTVLTIVSRAYGLYVLEKTGPASVGFDRGY